MQIGMYVDKMLLSELSGNVIGMYLGRLSILSCEYSYLCRFVSCWSPDQQTLRLHGQALGDQEDRDRRRAGLCGQQHCHHSQDGGGPQDHAQDERRHQ